METFLEIIERAKRQSATYPKLVSAQEQLRAFGADQTKKAGELSELKARLDTSCAESLPDGLGRLRPISILQRASDIIAGKDSGSAAEAVRKLEEEIATLQTASNMQQTLIWHLRDQLSNEVSRNLAGAHGKIADEIHRGMAMLHAACRRERLFIFSFQESGLTFQLQPVSPSGYGTAPESKLADWVKFATDNGVRLEAASYSDEARTPAARDRIQPGRAA